MRQRESEDKKLLVNASGFKDTSKNETETRETLIGKYLIVTSNDIAIKDTIVSLFFLRVKELRLDRNCGDTLERILQIKETANKLQDGK